MALIAVAAIPTVASFIARMGVTKAARKYAPKLIKEAQKYVKKHNLTKKFPTLAKKTAESMKKTTKKMQGDKKKVNPKNKKANKKTTTKKKTTKKKTATKKDSFDEQLKKKEGEKNFNTKNQQAEFYAKNFKKLDKNKLPVKKNELVRYYDDSKLVGGSTKASKGILSKLLPKTKAGAATTALGGAIVASSFIPKGDSKSKNTSSGSSSKKTNQTKTNKPSNFAAAFRKARKEKGTDSVFTYKGKQYSTVTMDEVKKAGFNTLREYLNAKKKKSGTTKPGTK